MKPRAELMQSLLDSRASMLTQLDQVDLNRKIYPLWTIREILAHICGWDDSTMVVIECLLTDSVPTTPVSHGIDAYNEQTVSTREGLDYDHVYREYLDTRKAMLKMLADLPDEKIYQETVLPWGVHGSVADLIEIFADHEVEHALDVQKIVAEAQDIS